MRFELPGQTILCLRVHMSSSSSAWKEPQCGLWAEKRLYFLSKGKTGSTALGASDAKTYAGGLIFVVDTQVGRILYSSQWAK